MSRKAIQCPFSATMVAGISFLTMRQNRQSVATSGTPPIELRRSNHRGRRDDGRLESQCRGADGRENPSALLGDGDLFSLQAPLWPYGDHGGNAGGETRERLAVRVEEKAAPLTLSVSQRPGSFCLVTHGRQPRAPRLLER